MESSAFLKPRVLIISFSIKSNNFSFDINEVKRRLDDSPGGILANLFPFYIANNTLYKSLSDLYKVQICPIPSQYGRLINANYNDILVNNYTNKRKYFYTYNSPIDIDDTIYFSTDFNEIIYSYDINLKLSELEKKLDKLKLLTEQREVEKIYDFFVDECKIDSIKCTIVRDEGVFETPKLKKQKNFHN